MSETARAEFERHCGPDCKYVDCEIFPRSNRVEIGYEILAVGQYFGIIVKNATDVIKAARIAGAMAKDQAAHKIAEAQKYDLWRIGDMR